MSTMSLDKASFASAQPPGAANPTDRQPLPLPLTANAELAVTFSSESDQLLGVIHPAAGETGVVVVVGGPQYRGGSHRQFVLLARTLSAAGYPVLRFDVRGMGDSSGCMHSFEMITPDIGAAISALMAKQPQLKRVVLWGLCDGASAALLYLDERPDPRVAGICLLNPWVRNAQSQARTQVKHYYRQRLMQRGFWTKLLSGQVAKGALQGLWRSFRQASKAAPGTAGNPEIASFHQRMARGWVNFQGQIALILSEDDYTAREFIEHSRIDAAWQAALRHKVPVRTNLLGADHTCTQAYAQTELCQASLALISSLHGRCIYARGARPDSLV